MNSLFARALIAFLVLPGVVAFLVPLVFIAPGDRTWLSNWWGVVPLGVGVLLILSGWAIGYKSWPLAVYALVVLVAFHLRVVLNEEPWLARTFGDGWVSYQMQVRRWL
jgi:protein-S-isoprenylcysteine O-methyltransferase Ste14